MEEEKMLKEKYNGLLESYNVGKKYLEENPTDQKAENKLNKISKEMENVLNALENYTQEEITNGFKIEEDAKVQENTSYSKQDTSMQVTVRKEENTLQSFTDDWKIATQLAKSTLFPDEFQGHPENVVVAIGMAKKMGMDTFTVAQNLHLIKGRLSWSGSFCKTLIEKTGQYKDLDLVYIGEEGKDSFGCYLEATRIRDGKRIKGNKVTVELAKKEGWWSKKDKYGNETSKWSTMTAQMLGYRAMAFFARLYCPEALNGVMTGEEVIDTYGDESREQPKDIL